jgi:hypothetical protein
MSLNKQDKVQQALISDKSEDSYRKRKGCSFRNEVFREWGPLRCWSASLKPVTTGSAVVCNLGSPLRSRIWKCYSADDNSFFPLNPHLLWGPQTLLLDGYRDLSEKVHRLEREVDRLPTCRVRECVELFEQRILQLVRQYAIRHVQGHRIDNTTRSKCCRDRN